MSFVRRPGVSAYCACPRVTNLRFDGGIRAGQAITPAFDSLLAKLIAYGATRAAAADTLADALRSTVLLGVPTNIDYLERVLRHPRFRSGPLHTGFLSEYAQELLPHELLRAGGRGAAGGAAHRSGVSARGP